MTSIAISRQQFLLACAALAASACGRATARTRLGHLLLEEPAARDYGAVVLALVRTVLAFEHPEFPAISPEQIHRRLLTLFPLATPDYLAFRRGLMIFDDATLLDEAPLHSGRFVEMSLDARRAYFRQWMRSDVATRRRFAQTAKALVMISAFSSEALWGAIGYEGPLLERANAPS